MRYTVRPLSDRTWLRPASRRQSTRFSASWKETENLLLDEVDRLKGRDLVIEVDVREQDLRLDGTLRANAREAATPGVVVAFDTAQHGPMLYRCDTFVAPYGFQGPDWQHNVRAIALTLQALRAVDRYGATETGQQYTGFKALPGPGEGVPMPTPTRMTSTVAAELLRSYGQIGDSLASAYRAAVRRTHPDIGGNRDDFDRVREAARVLGVAR